MSGLILNLCKAGSACKTAIIKVSFSYFFKIWIFLDREGPAPTMTALL